MVDYSASLSVATTQLYTDIPFKVYCNIVAVPLEYVYSLSIRI